MKREDLIKEWMDGRLSSEELDKKIQGDKALSDLKNMVTRSAGLDVPGKRTKEEAWNVLSAKIEKTKPAKVVRLNPYAYIGIAASVTLIAIAIYVFLQPEKILATKGQHISHTLPDGSEVLLNADSEVLYRPFNQDGHRKVRLKGEAYFQVIEGGRFEVVGDYATVVVIGTSFNVIQRSENTEVACFTGSVQVSDNAGARITLQAGEVTRTTDGKLTPATRFNSEKEAAWRNGDFYFESIPLETVLSELERQFDIDILYQSETPRIYTGYFNNKDLDEALQLVFQPMSLHYRKENGKIFVE